ncbi:MAG: ABC transporter substrate-binding protein [Dehalococcoidia bacterium]|nr:ABC transporter substrate-binding protein [Dehalococcoidia bacterium]
MEESTYWAKFWRGRVSRRRLLGGAALAGGGLAAAGIVGCGGEKSGPQGTGGPTKSGGAPSSLSDPAMKAEYPNDGRRQFTPAPADSRGGGIRYVGFDPVVLDRYDPHQTQFGPMYANQSAVFSKLYMYKSHEEPTWENILPDLAESAPEMIGDPPDTYIVKLRKGVKFHNSDAIRANFPSLAGRELTADDVLFSFERQRNENSPQRAYYYRSSQYGTILRMEKVDDYTIRFTTDGPVAPFYHFLADTNAMIVPREIVDQAKDTVDVTTGPKPEERMIGTGPFMWGSLVWGIEYKAVRNPAWFGWDDPSLNRPYLDSYVATGQGLDDSTIEALFREKKIDSAGYIDNPQWLISIKDEIPELTFQKQQSSGWVNSRMKTYCKPFDDWRVRKAFHLAVDRQEVVDVIGSNEWAKVGPVGGAVKYWALPQDELEALPGYRRGAEREEDIKTARQLYEAAGSPEIPQLWFANIPAYIGRFAATYVETIQKNLGANIRTISHPYSRIAEGLVKEECDQAAMTWGFDNGWIDLDDWVYPYFKTGAPKNSFKVSDLALDELLEAQRREFDADKRRALGYRIQKYTMGLEPGKEDSPAALARLDYAAPGGGGVAWPYLKNRTSWPWFGNSYWVAQTWLDKNDPSIQGKSE